MPLACSLMGHQAAPEVIANAGDQFSRCTRCSANLVRIDGKWATPPKGYAIIWRKANRQDAIIAANPAPAPSLIVERRGPQRRRNNLRSGLTPCNRVARADRRDFGTKVWNHR